MNLPRTFVPAPLAPTSHHLFASLVDRRAPLEQQVDHLPVLVGAGGHQQRAAALAVDGVNEGGVLLEERAKRILQEGDGSDGTLAAAAALYDECAQLWGFSKGAEHAWTRGARADAAELRSAICPIDSLV